MSSQAEIEIRMAQQIDAFMTTEGGRLVLGRADLDIQKAKQDLLDLEPYNFSTLVELQNKISEIQKHARTAILLQEYFKEAILIGNRNLEELEQPEE